MSSHWFMKTIFTVMLFITMSLTSADKDITSVNAGIDQSVLAGDTVTLAGIITFEDDNDDEDEKKEKKHKKKHKKEKKHDKKKHRNKDKKHKKKHKKDHDEDNDDIVIQWTQVSGTMVSLSNVNTLTATFTVPASLPADETLVFTVTVSDDDEIVASDSVDISATALALTSQVSGRVTAVDGSVVPNVSINVLSAGTSVANVSTGINGEFALDLDPNTDLVLVVTANGYANQVIPVRTPVKNGTIFVDISMIARGFTQSFAAADTVALSGADGAAVAFYGNSFVDTNGAPVVGNIDLTITPVDVSNPSALAAFPGDFTGAGDLGVTPIISFGTVEYNFSQNGQPVQLAPGKTADVLLPIYIDTYQDGSPISIGDIIPLWSLDEVTGIWTQEGTGTVVGSFGGGFGSPSPTGLALYATVSHFTWWNCDVSMNAAQAIVTVFGADAGTALIKARTTADIGYRPNVVDTVTTVGVPTSPLNIPSNGEVCFWAVINFNNGSTGATPEQCVTAGPNATLNIDLVSPIAGPLSVVTTPAATASVLDITAFQNYAVTRVQLQPSTFETTVNYTIISGALPAGLSLQTVNGIRSEIVGVPTVIGTYSVVVEASNGVTTDTVTINYTVTTDVPPPPPIDICGIDCAQY